MRVHEGLNARGARANRGPRHLGASVTVTQLAMPKERPAGAVPQRGTLRPRGDSGEGPAGVLARGRSSFRAGPGISREQVQLLSRSMPDCRAIAAVQRSRQRARPASVGLRQPRRRGAVFQPEHGAAASRGASTLPPIANDFVLKSAPSSSSSSPPPPPRADDTASSSQHQSAGLGWRADTTWGKGPRGEANAPRQSGVALPS